MFLYSAPLNTPTLKDEELHIYHEYMQKCDVKRVFFGLPNYLFYKENYFISHEEKVRRQIEYFREKGYEIGIWAISFGHSAINPDDPGLIDRFTPMESFDGGTGALCPMDERLVKAFCERSQMLARFNPDIIMFDDDYRYHIHGERHFCCCPLHMAEFRRRIGEDITKEELEKYILSGKPNKYRTEWQKVMGEPLVNLAKRIREAVDEINPKIRIGHCCTYDTWDLAGTDNMTIALAFAGKNTKPFLRPAGAPYHGVYVANAVENSRLQASYCRDLGIEVFGEGDTYVRPRYNVPSSWLELWDMGLLASGELDGALLYMFDYARPANYETGYADRHIINNKARAEIAEIFSDKKNVGVRVYEELHKFENWEFPDELNPKLIAMLERVGGTSRSQLLLSRNAVPTVYGDTEYPYAVFGENARYITEEELSNGAVIDISAARVLASRGIDTGYISSEKQGFAYENFDSENDYIERIEGLAYHNVKVSEKAEILTHMMPGECVGVYRYENAKGQRFLVFPFDAYDPDAYDNISFMCNYYRKKQLAGGIEWLCGKKLPAVVDPKHPMLYIQASENKEKSAMSVLFLNSFDDYEVDVEVELYKEYKSVRFVNCSGRFEGNRVIVDKIDAHGFAAFEVVE